MNPLVWVLGQTFFKTDTNRINVAFVTGYPHYTNETVTCRTHDSLR
jgi:hypothetical protein